MAGTDSSNPASSSGESCANRTSPRGGAGIEDLFDPALLKTVLDGKIFDPDKEHNAPGKYGKVAFAERASWFQMLPPFDFSGFAPVLDRIVAVLDHHAGLKAAQLGVAV
jgi:hypothetical protein